MRVVDDSTLKNRYKYCKYGKVLDWVEEFKFLIEDSGGYILVTMSSILEDIGIFDDHDKDSAYNGLRYHLFHYGIFVSRKSQKDNATVLKLRKRNEKDILPEFLARLQIPPRINTFKKYEDTISIPVSQTVPQNIDKFEVIKDIQNQIQDNTKYINVPEMEQIKRMLDESNFAPIWNPSPGEFIHGPVTDIFYDPTGNDGKGRTKITIDTRNKNTGKLGVWGSEVIFNKLEKYYGIKRNELVVKLNGKFFTIRYNGEKLSKSSSFFYKDYDILLLDNEKEMMSKGLYF